MTSVRRENKVKVAAMSLSASSPDGDDAPYLEWHGLDHMPEQYQIPGLLYGQRWASTPECRAARAMQAERFTPTNHVVQYLFGEPLEQAVDDWFTLGADLHRVGRFPFRLPAVALLGMDVVECHAAPSAPVTPEVLPERPNRGIYLAIESPDDPATPPGWTAEHLDRLLAVAGVAGLWTFTNGTVRPDRFDQTGFHATVVYLDGDPVQVAGAVAEVVTDRWNDAAVTPQLAAPFVTVRPWEWHRFSHPG
ncbi:MAG TPA: hypothetical protein VEP49_14560 [Acidimicrobiia bacterium]|nr:hypothetical protein [Acidimicrobiia bacterium]